MSEQFWTAGDIAREARRSHQAVIDATKKGWISPTGRTAGGIRLYRAEDATRFISEWQKRAEGRTRGQKWHRLRRKPTPKEIANRE